MKRFLLTAACALGALAPAVAQAPADPHRAEALKLAQRSGFTVTYNLQCRTKSAMPKDLFAPGAPAPLKLFDNLYYVGMNSVGAYVVKTSAGLILIDSLNNSHDAETVIVPGMKSLGLNPADLKYILISHAHGDHYGGAKWLHDTYGARVLASAIDWQGMENPGSMAPPPAAPGAAPRPARNWSPPPVRDLIGTDGEKLTLGDTTITLVLTPGHTPGTLSFIVPVTEHGQRHMLAMWGGTAIPNVPGAHDQYIASFDHFAKFTKPMHVDVELSNHPFVDGSLARMDELRSHPAGPNPFVIGETRYADYTNILKQCALAPPADAQPARPARS